MADGGGGPVALGRDRTHQWKRWKGFFAGVAALGALLSAGASVRPETSVDFYQFWGVGAARAAAPVPPPYAEPEPTRRALDALFAAETDPGLARLHRQRIAQFEPFGSPLLYTAFALLPMDYGFALQLFRAAQLAAFGLGVVWLVTSTGIGLAGALLAVAILALAYRPFGDDLFTANLNAIQLAAVVAAGTATARIGVGSTKRGAPLLLAALVGLASLKANLALVCGVLGLIVVARTWPELRARAVAIFVACLLVLVGAPMLYFRSAGVWLAWLRFAFFDDPRRLQDYSVGSGNASMPRWLFEQTGLDPLLGVGVILGVLAVSVALGGVGRRAARRLASTPLDALSLAIVVTLAIWPLVWFHYFVLALVPILRLLLSRPRSEAARVLAAVTLVIYSAAYLPLAVRAGLYPWLPGLWALTWIPLWMGWLAELRASEHRAA